jgi:hypothetical protein
MPESWERYNCQSLLGATLAAQALYGQAEPLLLSGYEGMLQRSGYISAESISNLKRASERIVRLYSDWGKPEKAAEWKQKLEAAKQATPKDHS